MPFICLTQPNIPDGTVQILDLAPNESQKNNSIDPPGQTRYIDRVQNDSLALVGGALFHLANPQDPTNLKGLAAYLGDVVDPGGAQFAVGTVTALGVNVADIVTIQGVAFTAAAAPDLPNQVFDQSGTDIQCAASLAAAINHVNAQALLVAAGGCALVAANGGTNVCTMTAGVAGTIGSMTLASSDGVTLAVSGTHLAKTMGTWTAALLNDAAVELIKQMDTGVAMTAAAINGYLNARPGISGISILGASSNASVVDLLSILAGRGYELAAGTLKDATGFSWDTTPAGGFQETVQVFGDVMTDGEWKPANPYVKFARAGRPSQQPTGGDADLREYKPIRYTVDGTEFTVSLGQGQIQGFANGVTLWPDSSLAAFVPTFYQPGPKFPETLNARVIVVYDDNGNVLA